jgi:hypothetical protein
MLLNLGDVMSQATIYFPESNDGPVEVVWGLPTRGQMLSHVEEFQLQVAREARGKYKIDPNKNQTGENANMGRKKSK